MMRDAILNFAKQFKYRPKIVGPRPIRLGRKGGKFIVAGMGGSHLAGDILKTLRPELDIIIWPNYGLPELPEKDWRKTSLVASSYSGNTEEPIDAFEQAVAKNLPVVAIAIGGKLLELAKKHSVPYVQMPDTGIQPRSALGFSLLALLKVMKQNDLLKEAKNLAKILDPKGLEEQGKGLAERLRGKLPIIYASSRSRSIAYNWKIKFNETGKVPAFYNVFPELNHNEINGMDVKEVSRPLSEKFYFLFIKDSDDHQKNQKRMEVTAKLYRDRGLTVEILETTGNSKLEKIFNSLIIADWAAFYTAEGYGLESEQVPIVEEFKKLIA